jgi:hypothetical protein
MSHAHLITGGLIVHLYNYTTLGPLNFTWSEYSISWFRLNFTYLWCIYRYVVVLFKIFKWCGTMYIIKFNKIKFKP